LASLDESAFSSIDSTNNIRPEWLKPPTNFFRLGPGDVIEVEMLGEATSRATVTIGPDGKIYYSLLPGLFVWGLTLSEAKELIATELGKYIRVKPETAVTLRTVGSKRVWILGSVQAPGVYALTNPVTLLEAIASAGGAISVPGSLSGMPDLQNSYLMRDGQILRVDFHKLISQGDLTQNIYLQPEDFIYLRSSTARNIYVLGAVALPTIVPYSDQLSLVAALASAGGTIEYAQVSHVALIRGSLANPRIAVVDYKAIYKGKAPDVRLQQGDVVYVPFVPYRKLAVFAEGVLRQFVHTIASNEGYRASGYPVVGGVVGPAPP
jgi:protein involved in polysaccharide export with SLBB domain